MRTGRKAVFDGIVMDVIEKGVEFFFLFNRMFPESPLPYVGIPMFLTRWRRVGIAHGQAPGEVNLHPPDPPRVVAVARRKLPDEMHVVGQDHGSEELKRLFSLDESHGIAKALHIGRLREPRPTFVCHERKEISAARHKKTSEEGHSSLLVGGADFRGRCPPYADFSAC
jgi:hypothetical protein